MKESDIEIGYAAKLPSGNLSLSSFVESLTDLQWKLALQKLYNDRNYTLLIKVIEKTDQDSLTHRKPGKAPFTVNETIRKRASNCIAAANTASSSQEGRAKKSRTKALQKAELKEDEELWSKLKMGEPNPSRNSRQEERLKTWKSKVENMYRNCTVLNERLITCRCGAEFAVNKFNELAEIGRVHAMSCKFTEKLTAVTGSFDKVEKIRVKQKKLT